MSLSFAQLKRCRTGLFLVTYMALHKEHRAQQSAAIETEKNNLC